jgi:threonine dehydratase
MSGAAAGPAPTYADVEAAARRIAPYVHRTPVLHSTELSRLLGARVDFKCENFQKAGAFKSRGACNAVFSLTDAEAARGVATHSSGNHAAALARAAALRGVPAFVVMPRGAPAVKRRAVEGYGGTVVECEPTLAAREAAAAEVVARTGAAFIHPFDDARVIAGQGTALKEVCDDGLSPDVVLAPVGGGGLMSGTALTARARLPGTSVWGAEPAGADDAARSLASGVLEPQLAPRTIADGLKTSLSPLTFDLIRGHVDGIATVEDGAILEAMRLVWHYLKIVVEPSCAVPVAALLTRQVEADHAVVILSGGNVDLDAFCSFAAPR